MFSMEMWGLLAPAFIAGLLIASTHVPLGQEVLKRGIIFIDLAIAQIAGLGVVTAHVFFDAYENWFSMFFALAFALGAGGVFSWLERRTPQYQEALIGCAFVLSASLIILLLANDPQGGEHMRDLLAGQILWVSWSQIALTGGVYALLLAIWFKKRSLFFLVFPITVTLSVQLIGVYLVFASLIIPALGTVKIPESKKLIAGYTIATLAFAGGLIVSTVYDMPSGPVIVCAYAVVSLLCFMKKW